MNSAFDSLPVKEDRLGGAEEGLRESLLWGFCFWISTHKNFFKELVERNTLKI